MSCRQPSRRTQAAFKANSEAPFDLLHGGRTLTESCSTAAWRRGFAVYSGRAAVTWSQRLCRPPSREIAVKVRTGLRRQTSQPRPVEQTGGAFL